METLKKIPVFYWVDNKNTAFQMLKALIFKVQSTPLQDYQKDLPVIIQADANKQGLGACLLQNGNTIAFTLKSVTDAEAQYVNIKKVVSCSLHE